jgi:uncharacterized surface protein with fasciclin (FAS1) repeats
MHVRPSSHVAFPPTHTHCAGLASAINDTTTWTILAPTNAAFEAQAALANITTDELLNVTLSGLPTLIALLSFHVIPSGAFQSTDLADGMNISTALEGANLTVGIVGGNITFTSMGGLIPLEEDEPSNATVLVPDIQAGASVIHVIDTLLMPPIDLLPNTTVPGAETFDTDLIGTAVPTPPVAPPLPIGSPAGEVGLVPAAESPAGELGLAPVSESPLGEGGLAPEGEIGLAPAGEAPAGEFGLAPVGEAPVSEIGLALVPAEELFAPAPEPAP